MRVSVKAIIIQDGQLLTLQCRDTAGQPFYVLPGGGQEPGESLHEALRRECREEIGVEVEPGPLRYARDFIPERMEQPDKTRQQIEMMFEARIADGGVPRAGHNPDAFQEALAWLPVAQLEAYVLYPLALRPLLQSGAARGTDVYMGVVQ